VASGQRVDFLIGGKSSRLGLGIDDRAVDDDIELAGATLDRLGRLGAASQQPVPRTEGARLVASGRAVFDANLHGAPSLVARPV
jgi:hypothetical protein